MHYGAFTKVLETVHQRSSSTAELPPPSVSELVLWLLVVSLRMGRGATGHLEKIITQGINPTNKTLFILILSSSR